MPHRDQVRERTTMEIQALRVRVTDADLAVLMRELLAEREALESVQARFLPEGVQVQGEYPTGFGFKVPFETLWQLTTAGADVQLRLELIKVAGFPAAMLRGALFRMIRDATEEQPAIRVEDETVLLDVPALAASQ